MQELVSDTFFKCKFTFYCTVLKSVACVAFACTPADEIRINLFL